MLRFLLCLAAFLQGIFAQGGRSLDSMDQLIEALQAGRSVSATFDSLLCEQTNFSEPFLGGFGIAADGTFILVNTYVDRGSVALLDVYEISGDTGLVLNNYFAFCTALIGATFHEKGNHQPDTAITSFDDLRTVMMERGQLTVVANVIGCEHPLPPEVTIAEGGSAEFQYYVLQDAGETMLFVEWPGLSLSNVEGQTVYTVTRAIINVDGTAHLSGHSYNTQTWEDEYPYPDGFQCVLGESLTFYYASGGEFASYATYADVDAAVSAGKDLLALVNARACEMNGTYPEILAAGVHVMSWIRWETGEMPGIHFTQSIPDVTGDLLVQAFYLAIDETLYVRGTTFNPVDPGDIPDVVTLSCPLGSGVWFIAAPYDGTELTSFAAIVQAELDGEKLWVEIDFSECVDPTGEFDLTGLRAGARLQDLTILGSGTAEERLFGSAFAVNGDSNSGVVYETFGVTIDGNDDAIVYQGSWRYDENGEWGNAFGDTIFECTLGGGVKVLQEV
ncbi:unnamed protein product [Darwinula stevensoni]|uniref:Uncharacterized protein n=1 Tax=Darwinula stevensoni TaxID=69355 RepID=A0A7R9FP54_9CRUS|nr:unnamed protein product [Darwinula stevensoni]CAG0897186.1 unnamed protein product [Darwinula stevensoni]